uniref:FACT complex subunit SSRP1 n=1 Tax=Parastrongyloides trichosuri TaxID=131310 RepID=A0A0N5A1H4_PARTI
MSNNVLYTDPNWKPAVDKEELAIKGWNQGIVEINGENLAFKIEDKLAFELPLANVANCTGQKNEATLEFQGNDDGPVNLIEMRFHMPQDINGDDETDRVEEFKKAVMEYANIVTETDLPLAFFSQLLCATPRGRYDVKVFPTHLSFHGKTYDYKINYRSVDRMFLLSHRDGRHVFFVVSINPPIRQGQTRYPYIVFEFSKDEMTEFDVNMSPEVLEKTYNGKIEPHHSGPVHEVFSKFLRVLTDKKVTVTGTFISKQGNQSIDCAYKQAAGFLFPLEKGFVYVHKPPMYIKFEDIQSINFDRSDLSTRTFDFEIDLKNGQTVTFNSIDKDENNYLIDYVKSKGLNVRNAKKTKDTKGRGGDDFDPYREALKKDAISDDDEDEEESDDEDYDVEKDAKKRKEMASSSEGSGSEPDEEYSSGDEDEDD